MQTLFVSWLLAPDYEGTRAGHRVKPYSALSAAGAAASSPKVGVWRPLIRPSKRPDSPRVILDLFSLSSTPAPQEHRPSLQEAIQQTIYHKRATLAPPWKPPKPSNPI